MLSMLFCHFFFFKQKTAYEMRISDWSSDVCSSDLSVTISLPYSVTCRFFGAERRSRLGSTRSLSAVTTSLRIWPSSGSALPTQREESQQRLQRYSTHELTYPPQYERPRSEDRRVGKERAGRCRPRWYTEQQKK